MNEYFALDWLTRDEFYIEFSRRDYNGFWMVEGATVPDWNPNLIGNFTTNDFLAVDYSLALNSWPVFSQRLRELIEQIAAGAIQFLPFRLLDRFGNHEVTGYYVGQILEIVDCLDRSRTKVANDDWTPINKYGSLRIREPFVLNKNLAAGHHLFRLLGCRARIVVSAEFKHAVEMANMLGIGFTPMQSV